MRRLFAGEILLPLAVFLPFPPDRDCGGWVRFCGLEPHAPIGGFFPCDGTHGGSHLGFGASGENSRERQQHDFEHMVSCQSGPNLFYNIFLLKKQ
mgnify:CR=1 FL=1